MSNYSDSQFDFSDPNSSWKMTFDRIPEKSYVLDIGSSSGNFGKELIERKKCIVDGIEINPDDAKIAEKVLRNVYVLDIERDELPNTKYEVIFMGDVVEHLARPIPTLERLKKLLKKDGIIVFSIPNITHMLVRIMLMKGKIEYGRTGLLDETHLHFYNQTEIYRVFTQAGYQIESVDFVKRDIPLDFVRKELEPIGLTVTQDFKTIAQSNDGAAYQFIGTARVDSLNTGTPRPLPEKSPISINEDHLRQVYDAYNKKIETIEQDLTRLAHENSRLREIATSNSYRIGRKVTLPIRAVKQAKQRFGKQYLYTKNIQNIKKIIKRYYGITMVSRTGRPNVALVIRSIEHPTSSTFIRMLSPLREIVKEYTNTRIELVDGDRPTIAKTVKTIIVQRTALVDLDAAKYIVNCAKANKAKLFVDTDDAFGDLDKNHPQYQEQKERIDALDFIIKNADEVWFSTKELKASYQVKKAKVVQNTLDPLIWPLLRSQEIRKLNKKPDAPLEIIYMGTKTHDGDFELVRPVFERLHEKYPGQFRLNIIGVASLKNDYAWLKVHHPPSGLYPEFVKWLSSLGPFDIGISPLENTKFNQNKSDIKCLDYLAIGVRPVVSDVSAYKNPQLNPLIQRVNNTFESWHDTLTQEIETREKTRKSRATHIKKGYKYILDRRTNDQASKAIHDSIT